MKLVGVLAVPFAEPRRFAFNLDSYRDFYPVIDCEHFDVVVRKFGKHYYDIYCDDVGLLLQKPPAIFTFDNDVAVELICGNCFVCKHDDNGDTISLTEDEVNEVLDNVRQGVLCCEL